MVDIADAVARDLAGESVRVPAQRAAFDALTCMVAGAARAPDRWAAVEPGAIGLIGTGRRGALLDAIGYNAATCHLLDRDDLHWSAVVHAGGIVWPVAFGVGEAAGATVGEVLDAGCVGYQVAMRMSRLLGPGHRRSFHATTTCGTVAAAAVAAALSDGPSADLDGVMRAASSIIGGTRQALADLSDTAIAHRAHAAVAGVVAARFSGSTPVGRPLDGELGFAAATGIRLDTATLAEPASPAIAETTVRSHPVSGFTHTMVDALLSLPPADPREVRSMRVEVPEAFLGADHRGVPTDVRHAKWHFATVAAVTATGALAIEDFPWPLDGDVRDLAERVQIVAASPPVGSIGARVTVDMTDGTTRIVTCEVPRGHPDDPLTDDELVRRSVELVAWPDEARARAVFDGLERVDAPVAEFLAVAGGSVSSP